MAVWRTLRAVGRKPRLGHGISIGYRIAGRSGVFRHRMNLDENPYEHDPIGGQCGDQTLLIPGRTRRN